MRAAMQDLKEGKSPSTAAGEFVRDEIEHPGGGPHKPQSRQQAIAIGLSKARQAGIPIKESPAGPRKKKQSK
jgi:hypothetical protein